MCIRDRVWLFPSVVETVCFVCSCQTIVFVSLSQIDGSIGTVSISSSGTSSLLGGRFSLSGLGVSVGVSIGVSGLTYISSVLFGVFGDKSTLAYTDVLSITF